LSAGTVIDWVAPVYAAEREVARTFVEALYTYAV
jgi:hypothetical protein